MNTKTKIKKSNSTSKIIRLLIVDDHQMVRDGIKVMLSFSSKRPMRFLIDEAEDGVEAVNKVMRREYDVVLLDYNLSDKNGAAIAEDILFYKPEIKILALSNYDEVAYVESMIKAGVKGYILKNVEPLQLYKAIKTVLSGEPYYSSEIALKLLEFAKQDSLNLKKDEELLTPRQMEVLILICKEKTNKQIADELFVSKRTIDTHRQNLLMKFGVKNTAGLIRAAYKLGLIK